MSITELGALGEFLASFGVIATIVYLAIQMRQKVVYRFFCKFSGAQRS